ncbi:MAG: hypothetical protein ACOCQ4_02385 [bacterium]
MEGIKKVRLFWAGDPSVGIFDQEILLKDDNDDFLLDLTVYDEGDKKQILEDFRKSLAHTFELAGDGKPVVVFDFEDMEAEAKLETLGYE